MDADLAPPAGRGPPPARLAAAALARLHGLAGRRLAAMTACFGTGIGAYFALPAEPSLAAFVTLATLGLGAAVLGWRRRHGFGLLAAFVAALAAGLVAAQLRTNAVAAPVLAFRYYGPVEGRVVEVDRSSSGQVRVTLDRVRLDRVAPRRTPARVRLSLHDDGAGVVPRPGLLVMTTAHLMPPSRPAEPGGFDFQRHAWFERLGGVGYAQAPLLLASREVIGGAVGRARLALARDLQRRLPGDAGAVAAAIVTGDRSGLTEPVVARLRDANLAHLLAISGLHMGLLVGLAFGAVRFALACLPGVALRHPIRSWAAAAAIPVACAYLVLSGGSVATQRAFVMAGVMLAAVILGRRAVSLRSLALAGAIVLGLRPEALLGPGFQMSFAATGALILAFDRVARSDVWWRRGVAGAVAAVVISSVVAGLATAPFAAAHFNRVGQYGLLANLLAVPAMGAWVMPLLLAGLMLTPLGLGDGPITMAGWGIEWILAVAGFVAGLDGSVLGVPTPPAAVVPALGLACAAFACAGPIGRAAAAALAAAAFAAWSLHDRPAILVAESGGLVGIDGAAGRWLSWDSTEAFVAEAWLENDGDLAGQAGAASRPRVQDPDLPPVVAARGVRETEAAAAEGCSEGAWLVTNVEWDGPAGGCRIIDARWLRGTGALAVRAGRDGPVVRTVAGAQGARPWTGHGVLRGWGPDGPRKKGGAR